MLVAYLIYKPFKEFLETRAQIEQERNQAVKSQMELDDKRSSLLGCGTYNDGVVVVEEFGKVRALIATRY